MITDGLEHFRILKTASKGTRATWPGAAAFACGALFFVMFWMSMGGELFGGDLVNLAALAPSSYRIGESELKDPAALARILSTDQEHPDWQVQAVAFAREAMGNSGMQAAEDFARDPSSYRALARFLHTLNVFLVDPPLDWPPGTPGLTQARTNGFSGPEANAWILSKVFKDQVAEPRILTKGVGFFSAKNLGSSFQLQDSFRYAPLTKFYCECMINFALNTPLRLPFLLGQAAILFGVLTSLVYLFCRRFLPSGFDVLACVACMTSMSVLTSSFTLFSLPYQVVTIFLLSGILASMRFTENGSWPWLAAYALSGIIGPWFREFGGILPFVVAGAHVLDFKPQRSPAVLVVSAALMVHAAVPSLLPWLIGLNNGKVISLLSMGKATAHAGSLPNWHLMGTLFVQFPPLLWLAALLPAIFSLAGFAHNLGQLPAPSVTSWLFRMWDWIKPGWPAGDRLYRILTPFALLCSAAGFAWVFFVGNYKLEHLATITQGDRLFLFLGFFCVVSLRFGVLPFLYIAAFLVGYLRWSVAEVHMAFLMPPLAVMLTGWIATGWYALQRLEITRIRTVAITIFLMIVSLGFSDQVMNVYTCIATQSAAMRTNKAIAAWAKHNIPKHSIVVSNFFNYVDIFIYSDRHFDPYESVENNPLGERRTIHSDGRMKQTVDSSQGTRKIYLLEAEHAFFAYQADYHSHKWTKHPPGHLIMVADFQLQNSYYYIDPFKFFVPRYWISFPAYMDWNIDFWWDNTTDLFRREFHANYKLYELVTSQIQ